jgi:hypothetical protein
LFPSPPHRPLSLLFTVFLPPSLSLVLIDIAVAGGR